MSSAVFQHQMVVGVGTALTSAILSAVIVFFLLVMRQRLHDKQLMLRGRNRMRPVPFQRQGSYSGQSGYSASGYSAGFRGPSRPEDIQNGRQIRTVRAYNERSFSQIEGTSMGGMIDPWQPGRGRPLHPVHDPFYGRSRGQNRTAAHHQGDSLSSAPPSEGHPAVAAFRASVLPATPTTFYTYDGRIESTLNDTTLSRRHYDARGVGGGATSRDTPRPGQGQGKGQAKVGRDGRTYYYGRQHSNQSLDSGLRELGASASTTDGRALGASASISNLYASPKKQYYRKKQHSAGDSSFPWHSTPIRQSAREPRLRKPSLPRTATRLRRSSLDSLPSPSKEPVSWSGVEPHWRSDLSDISSSRQRSGSYDELESRRQRRRYDSTGDDDGLAVFNWSPSAGPVISLDHKPSSTYDGDVQLEPRAASDAGVSSSAASLSEPDDDSALYSMEDLPRFTKSTAKLDLSNSGAGEDNEALQLEEMYY